MSKDLKEAIKQGLRVVVLAIIPVLIDSLGKGMVDIKVVLVTGAVAGLMALDKYLHENAPAGVSGGLTRF